MALAPEQLFSVDDLIAASESKTLSFTESGPSRCEIYENGGSSDDFDDRIVITASRGETWKMTDGNAIWTINHLDMIWIKQRCKELGSIRDLLTMFGPSDDVSDQRADMLRRASDETRERNTEYVASCSEALR